MCFGREKIVLGYFLNGLDKQVPSLQTAMFPSSACRFPLVTMLVLTSAFLCDVTHGMRAVNMTSASGQPEVTLEDGTLLLGLLDTTGQRHVATFLGIPFAVAPTGPLRFKKTVGLMSPNVTQLNATQYGPACLAVPAAGRQSEDCLYLNVWVPVAGGSSASQQPLASIVHIHGGAFIMGSGFYSPGDWLAAENDVIVVSMNYRLGPLGFLSTGDSASVGNYGLWDQHTALLWVRHNIAAFGGDPGAVTLMGESAGGQSVSFQMLSPHSGGLFHRAIMQSGTFYCPIALQWTPVETAIRLGRAVGCDHSAHDVLVDCLRTISAFHIANASASLWLHDKIRTLVDFGWAPVEDGDFVPPLYAKNGTLLPLPTSAAFNGTVMIGVNNNEGSLFKQYRVPVVEQNGDPNIEVELVNLDFFKEKLMPDVLEQMFKTLAKDAAAFSTAAEVIAYRYKDWTSGLPTLIKPDMYAALGDPAFVVPSFQLARQWLSSGSTDRGQVYFYVFDNHPEVSAEESMAGMKHGDDIAYTFGSVEQQLRRLNATEVVVTKEMKLGEDFRKLLTNFAKSGNPSTPSILPHWPAWPTYNLRNESYMAVSSTPGIATRYKAESVALWTDLVPAIVTRKSITCPAGPKDGTSAACSCLPHILALTLCIVLFYGLYSN